MNADQHVGYNIMPDASQPFRDTTWLLWFMLIILIQE